MIEIRPATRADFIRFYDRPPPMTMKALVAVNGDDEPVALGGYYLSDGRAVAFTDHKPGKITKRDMVRGGRALLELFKKLSIDVVAVAKNGDATALKHFGFETYCNVWRLRG